jgi:hypothetical protein
MLRQCFAWPQRSIGGGTSHQLAEVVYAIRCIREEKNHGSIIGSSATFDGLPTLLILLRRLLQIIFPVAEVIDEPDTELGNRLGQSTLLPDALFVIREPEVLQFAVLKAFTHAFFCSPNYFQIGSIRPAGGVVFRGFLRNDQSVNLPRNVGISRQTFLFLSTGTSPR